MSKIICDVCGTSYPESATQCPICGCVRSGDPVTVSGDTREAPVQTPSAHTYVKGGRFSKSNVKKRNSGKPIYSAETVAKPQGKERTRRNEGKGKTKELGLLIAVIALLIVVAVVVVYIASSVLNAGTPNETEPVGTTVNTQPTDDTTVSATEKEMTLLSDAVILFGAVGEIMRVEHGWSEMQGGILMLCGAMCVIGLYIVSTRRK